MLAIPYIPAQASPDTSNAATDRSPAAASGSYPILPFPKPPRSRILHRLFDNFPWICTPPPAPPGPITGRLHSRAHHQAPPDSADLALNRDAGHSKKTPTTPPTSGDGMSRWSEPRTSLRGVRNPESSLGHPEGPTPHRRLAAVTIVTVIPSKYNKFLDHGSRPASPIGAPLSLASNEPIGARRNSR